MCFEMQRSSVFCDEVLCVITHKSYSVTVMVVNVFPPLLLVCECVGVGICTNKITYVQPATGWVLVNSPQGKRFHFLGNEPHSSVHIWLLCTYYSQWPNQTRFAHSDQQLHNVRSLA